MEQKRNNRWSTAAKAVGLVGLGAAGAVGANRLMAPMRLAAKKAARSKMLATVKPSKEWSDAYRANAKSGIPKIKKSQGLWLEDELPKDVEDLIKMRDTAKRSKQIRPYEQIGYRNKLKSWRGFNRNLSTLADFSSGTQVKAHTRNGKLIRAYSRDEQKVRNKENFKNLAVGAAALLAPSLIGLAATKGNLKPVPEALLRGMGLIAGGLTYTQLQNRDVRKHPGFYHPKSRMLSARKDPKYKARLKQTASEMGITPREMEQKLYEWDKRRYESAGLKA